MTVRVITSDGSYKILECIDVEIDPVKDKTMTVKNGVLHIKE